MAAARRGGRGGDIFLDFCVQNELFYRQAVKSGRVPGEEGAAVSKLEHATHILMDGVGGGVLVVPPELERDFVGAYAAGISVGNVYYLVEMPTETFRYVLDLDFKGPAHLTRAQIVHFLKIIQKTVSLFWDTAAAAPPVVPPSSSSSSLSSAEDGAAPKKRKRVPPRPPLAALIAMVPDEDWSPHPLPPNSGSGAVKTGIHVVFPDLFVTRDMCMAMRDAIIAALERDDDDAADGGNKDTEKGGKGDVRGPSPSSPSSSASVLRGVSVLLSPEWNDWEDIVDACIYRRNGIRAAGSAKCTSCPDCYRDSLRKKTCITCSFSGTVSLGRVYRPRIYLDGRGAENAIRAKALATDFRTAIRLLTVRIPQGSDMVSAQLQRWRPPMDTPPAVPTLPDGVHPASVATATAAARELEERVHYVYHEKPLPLVGRKRTGTGGGGGGERGGWGTGLSVEDYKGIAKVARSSDQCVHHVASAVGVAIRRAIGMLRPSLWGNLTLRNIWKKEQGGGGAGGAVYTVFVKGMGANCCLNLPGFKKGHRSNTIYFQITRDQIVQRCNCSCVGPNVLKNRVTGLPCSQFREAMPMPDAGIQAILFGGTAGGGASSSSSSAALASSPHLIRRPALDIVHDRTGYMAGLGGAIRAGLAAAKSTAATVADEPPAAKKPRQQHRHP